MALRQTPQEARLACPHFRKFMLCPDLANKQKAVYGAKLIKAGTGYVTPGFLYATKKSRCDPKEIAMLVIFGLFDV